MTTELEALEQAITESPEDISAQCIFKDKLSLWVVGNEKVIDFTFKARTNDARVLVERPADKFSDIIAVNDGVSIRKVRGTDGIWHDAVERWNVTDLAEPSNYRAIGACYDVEYPQKDYPDHTIFPRDPRNASPTRKKDAKTLNAFWDYRELNKSVEPLQSSWMQADNDNYADPEREEGDPEKPERDVEAELEMRPVLKELVDGYSVPTVQYKTRQVGLVTGPRLSDCGYCMTPTSPFIRETIVPVSGDVECIVSRTTFVMIKTRLVERTRDEIVKIGDLKKDEKWTLTRIGDLRFAPFRTNYHYRGQVTHYRDNGRWYPVKEDVYGTPYGPKSEGSNDVAWVPLYPRTSKSNVGQLSPTARAKQRANRDKPVPCPMPTDEMLEAFRLKLEANGKPANGNRRHHDGLPYDVKAADELQFGYAFGKTYTKPAPADEPFDNVTERGQTLSAVNARLSPQNRLVAKMVVLTDETETLAQNYAEIGAAVATGRKTVSERTLIRHGQLAANEAAAEIGTLLQELAA